MMACTIGVYRLAKLIFSQNCGLIAAAVFVLFELQFFGNGIWYEQFTLPFLLAAAHHLARIPPTKTTSTDCLIVGTLFGLAALFKQQVFFVFLGALILFVLWRLMIAKLHWKQIAIESLLLMLSAAFPLLINFLVLTILGAAENYLYGAFYQPLLEWRLYRAPSTSFFIQLATWITLSGLFLYNGGKATSEAHRYSQFVVVIFFLTSLSFDYPNHGRVHLIPAAAFVSVMAAYLTTKIRHRSIWSGAVLLALYGPTIADHIKMFRKQSRYKFQANDVRKDNVAKFIQEHTSGQETVFAAGDLLFYVRADRLPATYNPYGYWWLMHGKFGIQSIVDDLERVRPRFLVFDPAEISAAESSNSKWHPVGKLIARYYEQSPQMSNGYVWQRK